ncbi:hypothetical protein TH15_21265 [Thalassospira profundimaris]|nr:hypothetical protein TH15_21265 [Thalassospira profundimaris]
MSVYERLLAPENLNYAWIKAKNLYRMADGYVDRGEIAAFELDLENRLELIRRQFKKGRYRLKKLRPLPRPKKISKDQPEDRQYYHVAIDDQVAWLAMVNALGPELDLKMEPWSYGNRLYRPAWYERDEARNSKLEIGPYRHASGHLYRKFQHSWPLFRRHVTLTARMMVERRKLRDNEMDDADRLAAITAEHANLAYFRTGYWPDDNPEGSKNDLYHASIDLKQFFPKLKIDAVARSLHEVNVSDDSWFTNLVTSMLNFRVDMTGVPNSALENVVPQFQKGSVNGIPTGLFVAGFLANAAMLPIDRKVAEKLDAQHNVAHFRFVDDHTIIAYDFDTLCEWLLWYEKLLVNEGVGPSINEEKFDPPSLGNWMERLKKGKSLGELKKKHADDWSTAILETKLDGKNPTKLMTKTLAQVSTIAATDIHILDDDDLDERLKMLEWLLLADIPEREIRPDTRASFAAGQIASLVPVLVQEADGLVDAARDVARFKAHEPVRSRSTDEELQVYKEKLAGLEEILANCMKEDAENKNILLGRCFSLLLQSLREYPGKARLFYRTHQYCRITGYHGLRAIAEWLKDTRIAGQAAWADYYIALSMQIIAAGLLATVGRLMAMDALQSDIEAAASHLRDVASLDNNDFRVPPDRETWYHAIGRREFGVALLQVAQVLWDKPEYRPIARKLSALSNEYLHFASDGKSDSWLDATGWTPGVWAHLAENSLGTGGEPSTAWLAISPFFAFEQRYDRQASRRYPAYISAAGWEYFLKSQTLPANDSAWLREVIVNDEARRKAAYASRKIAFRRAARSLERPDKKFITIAEWTNVVRDCNAFDPRRSEWTALEILEQLIAGAVVFGRDETVLDRVHPFNVLLPREWVDHFPCKQDATTLSWEDWRQFAKDEGGRRSGVVLRESAKSVFDYRYAESGAGQKVSPDERRLTSLGRLLLGLLKNDHSAPQIWNMRGNELVFPFPRSRWFRGLAISSLTTQLLEACLGARPAETRTIARQPALFGWEDGRPANDVNFEPLPIYSPSDLLNGIRSAQRVLEGNQIAVTRNQPRQLIPFRIADFSAGDDNADGVDEGVNDGQ